MLLLFKRRSVTFLGYLKLRYFSTQFALSQLRKNIFCLFISNDCDVQIDMEENFFVVKSNTNFKHLGEIGTLLCPSSTISFKSYTLEVQSLNKILNQLYVTYK